MTKQEEEQTAIVRVEQPDDRPLRACLLDVITPCAKNGQGALVLLDRLERALLAAATAAARDAASDARIGFEVGAQRFMEPL